MRGPMSIRLMADVLENYEGDPTRKLIYLILANHANDQGICWPSIETVAEQANVSKRQAFRHIAALRKEARLQVKRRKEQTSIYRLLTSVNDMGDTFESVMGVTQNRNSTKQVSTSSTSTTVCVGFDEFWKAYPRKVGKGDARRAFEKAAKKVQLPVLLAALDLQKRGWDDPKFIPFPATWLNGERWEDEIKTESVLPEGAV